MCLHALPFAAACALMLPASSTGCAGKVYHLAEAGALSEAVRPLRPDGSIDADAMARLAVRHDDSLDNVANRLALWDRQVRLPAACYAGMAAMACMSRSSPASGVRCLGRMYNRCKACALHMRTSRCGCPLLAAQPTSVRALRRSSGWRRLLQQPQARRVQAGRAAWGLCCRRGS